MRVPVPASVIEMLETNNVIYQLKTGIGQAANAEGAESLVTPDICLVKSLLLQDSQGVLQILLPSDHMVDLAAVKIQSGRDLNALPAVELAALIKTQELHAIPAIPQWQDLPTLVDASLLRHKTLQLDTGGDQILEVKQEDFQSMIKSTSIGDIAIATPQLPESAEDDQEQIIYSLENFTQLRIKQRIEETLELPPLPETAQRIIKLRANPDADICDLSTIVELDPSLAAQVVSWASSPYYSAPGQIKSVHDAIVRVLGFDMVLNLSLGLALGKSFNPSVMTTKKVQAYWLSAICTAAVVEGLVTSIPREHRPSFGMAYLSGLINNFGELILAEVFPPYYDNLMRHFDANPHISKSLIEQQLIGVSSCQITSWLLQAWNMPDEVVIAIRHQNNPNYNGEHCTYSKLNHLARKLLNNKRGALTQDICDSLFEELHIERQTAEITVENILESADDLQAISDKIQG